MGKVRRDGLSVGVDRHLKLAFRGATIPWDAGWLSEETAQADAKGNLHFFYHCSESPRRVLPPITAELAYPIPETSR